MGNSVTENTALISRSHLQKEQSQGSTVTIFRVLGVLKTVFIVPVYFVLMSGLKVIDVKDRLLKKKKRSYFS